MDVGVDSTYNMLCELAEQSNNTWYIDGRRVGFGLGSIQWSFARTLNLVNAYREINNNSFSFNDVAGSLTNQDNRKSYFMTTLGYTENEYTAYSFHSEKTK